MTLTRALRVTLGLSTLLATASLAMSAWAQGPTAPGPAVTSPPAVTPAQSVEDGGLIAVGLALAVVVILVIAARLLDLKDKREEQATHLQSLISDALLGDRTLADLPVAPGARVPLWRGSPVTITLRGRVPTPERRQAVLHLVEREATRIRSDFRIDDRIAVVPSAASIAA